MSHGRLSLGLALRSCLYRCVVLIVERIFTLRCISITFAMLSILCRAIIGEVDDEAEGKVDLSTVRGAQLKSVVH